MIYLCACCGVDLGNGGVDLCVVVAELDKNGDALTLRFGRECGCAGKILTHSRVKAREEAGLDVGRTVAAKRRR